MPRFILGLVFVALLVGARPGTAEIVPLGEATAEMVMGRADAPVTIIEYSSLTCPHCAAFHRDTLPRLKSEYIDTGKVRFVYRDFPLGALAMAAAMVARCAGTERYFGFVEVLFRSQAQWGRASNPRDALARVARMGGMSEADFNKCLVNVPLMQAIQKGAKAAEEKYEINSTPTFFIGDTKIPGNAAFERFKEVLDKALRKSG